VARASACSIGFSRCPDKRRLKPAQQTKVRATKAQLNQPLWRDAVTIAFRSWLLIRVWYPLPCDFSQAMTSASSRIVRDCFTGR
jgi:hypothetical protein